MKLRFKLIAIFFLTINLYAQEIPGAYTIGQITINHSLFNALTANKGYEVLDFSATNHFRSNQNNMALYCMGGISANSNTSLLGVEVNTTLTSFVRTKESCQIAEDYEGGFLKFALSVGLDKNIGKGFSAAGNLEYGLNYGFDLKRFTTQLYHRLSLNPPKLSTNRSTKNISVMEKLVYLYFHLWSKKKYIKSMEQNDQFSYYFILTMLHPFLRTMSNANKKNPFLSARWKNHFQQNAFPKMNSVINVPLDLILNLMKKPKFSLKKHISLFQNNILRNDHFPYCDENVFDFQHCTETIADFLILVDVFKASLTDCHATSIETNVGINLSLSFADLMKLKTKVGINASASLGYNFYHLEKRLSRDTNIQNTSKISKQISELYNMKYNNIFTSSYRLFTSDRKNHLKKSCHQVTNIAAHTFGQYLSLYKY